MLIPHYSLQIGTQAFAEQGLRLEVERGLAPTIGYLRATLPYRGEVPASVGDPVELTLSGGEEEAVVFTGTVARLEHGEGGVEVIAADAGLALSQLRPTTTYQGQLTSAIIRDLADQAGVDTATLGPGEFLAAYLADDRSTAWEHITRLAGWTGADILIDRAGQVAERAGPAVLADIAKKQGRDVLAIKFFAGRAAASSYAIAGEGAGTARTANRAFRFTADALGSPRPSAPVRLRYAAALRERALAQQAARSWADRGRAGSTLARLVLLLEPRLEPGTLLEVQETAEPIPLLRIQRVEHVLGRGGAITRVQAVAAAPPSDGLGGLGGVS